MKQTKIILFFAILMTVGMHQAHAGAYLGQNAETSEVGTVYNNQSDQFYVKLKPGIGTVNCATIVFPEAFSHTPIAYSFHYSSAMTALKEGLKVDIYTYEASNSCFLANFIAVKN